MFTSVQVDKEDDFPHNICSICRNETQKAYLFDLKCKKSEIILRQLREISANLEKLNEILIQNDIVCDVAGELESILKEDFNLEDVMNICDRDISDFESSSKASEKLYRPIVKEECTGDLQLAFKSEPEQSNHCMTDDTNEKDLERIEIMSNFQIIEEKCDSRITLKQEPDHNSPIIKNNACKNELELNQNSSNFKIMDECVSGYQVIFKTEPDQNILIIKDNGNEEEVESSVTNFPVTFKSEPELDIGIDCYDDQLQCSACLKQFQSLDVFRGHIVSDHLEENICKICNEEFECSQFEHSAKHLPFSEPESPSDSSEESIRQTEKVHIKAIHKDKFVGKREFRCKICSKVFVHKYLLVNHMRKSYAHTGEKRFQCELCPKKFGGSRALLYHRRTKHTDELINDDKPVADYKCSVCYKVFGFKSILGNHMRVHTGEQPFQCKLCPKKFRSKQALLRHQRNKHTDKLISDGKPVADFQCSVCYKVFCREFGLRRHMRVHTGEKPFQCELCPGKFRNSKSLLSHRQAKHTDELIGDGKPVPDFQCSVCNKVFRLKCILRNHMRVHTGEKPFDCELCPEKFRNNYTLRYHRRTKHTDELTSDDKPVSDFQCSVCYKVFGLKSRLRNHMRIHTGERPFNCELCPEKFRHKIMLKCHRRTKHRDELINDDKSISDLQCSICCKVFGLKDRLKKHMRIHTGENSEDSGALLLHRRAKHRDELIIF